jgi:serine/threonine protein kinase
MALRRVGDVLAAKYRIEALLGSGGMGDVYRATNVVLHREVAIKLLHVRYADDANLVERFLREARVANVVRHPNVVDVLDIDKDADGAPFIVQELLQGEDLARFLREHGRLTLEEIRLLVLPIIEALAEAHARGVIHRDIKPANIFLAKQHGTLEGPPSTVRRAPQSGIRVVPKLLDFGISKLRSANVRATDAGELLGTPAYMAPEVLHGVRDADARTDVWALGVMLFELLAGRRPFTAPGPSVFVAIATTEAPPLADVAPDVDPEVAAVVDRCLRRAVDQRFASAAELATALASALQAASLRAPTLVGPPASRAAPFVPELDLPRTLGGADATYVDAVQPSFDATLPSRGTARSPEATGLMPVPSAPSVPPPVPPLAESPRRPIASRAPQARRPPTSGLELDASPRSSLGPSSLGPTARLEARARAQRVDVAWLPSLLVLGTAALALSGVMMAVAGQGGFTIVRPPVQASPHVTTAVQLGAALGAAVASAWAFRGGMRTWRGSGPRAALAYAAASGALLFAALKLLRGA